MNYAMDDWDGGDDGYVLGLRGVSPAEAHGATVFCTTVFCSCILTETCSVALQANWQAEDDDDDEGSGDEGHQIAAVEGAPGKETRSQSYTALLLCCVHILLTYAIVFYCNAGEAARRGAADGPPLFVLDEQRGA
jgi:hypothetical protein